MYCGQMSPNLKFFIDKNIISFNFGKDMLYYRVYVSLKKNAPSNEVTIQNNLLNFVKITSS